MDANVRQHIGMREAVVVAAIGITVAGTWFLVTAGSSIMTGQSTALLQDPCTQVWEDDTRDIDWEALNSDDVVMASQGQRGALGSSGFWIPLNLQALARASDYVGEVEVVRIGGMRHDTADGSRPLRTAGRNADVDAMRAYVPVLLRVRQLTKPARGASSVCGFIAPVWVKMGPQDEVADTLLASHLQVGLVGEAFLRTWQGRDAPWAQYLSRHAKSGRIPLVSIGKFYPFVGGRVLGYQNGSVPVERFADELSAVTVQ